MKKKLVVVGNGMAPGRALERLLESDPDSYEITIFNAEKRVNYDRILLSPVLSGEKKFEEIIIHGDRWYEKHNIALVKGRKVISIDRVNKRVTAEGGMIADYDKLLIATGSSPFILPIPGNELPGVLSYRDLDDVQAMMIAAEQGWKNAVIIGGGLLGLEAAAGLKTRGMDVTVLHLPSILMERQLDLTAGHLLQRELESRGIKVITNANTTKIVGDGKVEAIELEDGSRLDADLVVMAVGIRPNSELGKQAELDVDRGIKVDEKLRTSDPDIFAIGECVEFEGSVYGLVAPLYEMANIVAMELLNEDNNGFSNSVLATKLKVTGIDLYSAGDFSEGEEREEIVLRDGANGIYKRLILQDDKIIGTVLYGDTSDGAWFFQLIKDGTDISEMRDTLIFGPAFAGGSPLDPMAAVAALPDNAEICGCNGICKSAIVSAIADKNLTSLDDVRAHTKASASCGSCTGLVEQLLVLTLGDTYDPAAVQPMCGCTDLGHGDVRRLIVADGLKTIADLMQALQWKSSGGCAKCRPALNYYLLATWPGEYVDDGQSRYINERVHANIQKNGTYSVVPRMWGGMTSSKELRAIADVVDKFEIPAVKCTGGQRIDMLGIKKEDLLAVWSDLNDVGLVSGHAYAKGLRTVKTCVGTDWCRFGTQDSTGFGVRLEKFLWGSWTPGKVKLAVSGCPRNCSEATCKDIGIVCVDSGFEIKFAGAAGLDIKGTEDLCHTSTEDEAFEIIVALVQHYREQGHYLERIYKWARRVGNDSIKAAVVDDTVNRKALFERFVFAQKFSQSDPWSERVSGAEAYEFNPMSEIKLGEAAE